MVDWKQMSEGGMDHAYPKLAARSLCGRPPPRQLKLNMELPPLSSARQCAVCQYGLKKRNEASDG